jgi:hypothetical protein
MNPRHLAALVPTALIFGTLGLAAAAGRKAEGPPATSPAPAASRPPGGAVPLNKEGTVLLDAKNKKLIVQSEVVFREGMLEMLLCKKNTKEHESVLAFDGKAYILHAGLVAIGLEPGKPLAFMPDFTPPSGPKLKIEMVWTGEDGKEHREDARRWIRHSIHRYFGEPLEALPAGLTLPKDGNLRYDPVNKELSWYGPMTEKQRDDYLALSKDPSYRKAVGSFFDRTREKEMEADWVFAGSGFATDESDGHKVYLAESGDVICVANFPSAMIDVAQKSSAEGQESLLYEAWTERVPPVGTPVRLEITPAPKKPENKGQSQSRPAGSGRR